MALPCFTHKVAINLPHLFPAPWWIHVNPHPPVGLLFGNQLQGLPPGLQKAPGAGFCGETHEDLRGWDEDRVGLRYPKVGIASSGYLSIAWEIWPFFWGMYWYWYWWILTGGEVCGYHSGGTRLAKWNLQGLTPRVTCLLDGHANQPRDEHHRKLQDLRQRKRQLLNSSFGWNSFSWKHEQVTSDFKYAYHVLLAGNCGWMDSFPSPTFPTWNDICIKTIQRLAKSYPPSNSSDFAPKAKPAKSKNNKKMPSQSRCIACWHQFEIHQQLWHERSQPQGIFRETVWTKEIETNPHGLGGSMDHLSPRCADCRVTS